MIHFACPTCKNPMQAPEHTVGTKLNCAACGQRLQVPQGLPPVTGAPLPRPDRMSDATQATRQPANSLALIFGGVAAGGFVLLGVLCVAYIFVSVRGPEKPVAGLPVSAGAPIEIAGPEPTPRLSVPPPPELPPEQFVLSQLYQRFQRNRSEVKRAVVGKRIEVDLEDRTWQVEDLNANADGIIELIATQQSAFGVEVHMILRFSQSKDKIASRMQRYAENRRRGETVRFVVTGKLDVEKRRGSEFLVLHDVALK